MREINISNVISTKRKEKNLTQDELAEYIGVTKASVSKWETGQSYPDITFLPQLAAYFNISIDELIGYLPQMTPGDIKKNYTRLANEFATKPFKDVYEECQGIIKKYYSCFPLIFQMTVLLMNHFRLAPEKEKQEEILNEIISLSQHIKKECEDVWLAKQANSLEAVCYLMLQQPLEVLDLLEGTLKPIQGDEVILSSAYQMRGNTEKAKSVLQISIYQHIMILVDYASAYLSLCIGQNDQFDKAYNRFVSIAEVFEIKKLRADLLLKIYYIAALEHLNRNDEEKALEMLTKFMEAGTSENFAEILQGDEFFDMLKEWFEEFGINQKAPRDKKLIKDDVLKMVKDHPAFERLSNYPGYKNIIHKLELNLNGGN